METVTALSTTNFTQKHVDIASDFVNRVIQLLENRKGEPTTYGIDSESWENRESLKLKISDKVTLEVHLKTRN